jgi:hypothetical protein
MRAYRVLYRRIGGRPWTDILRDSADRHTLLWLVAAFGAGILAADAMTWPLWASLLVGVLLGHLFW